MSEKRIIKEKTFSLDGKNYIARLYNANGKSSIYGEIVYQDNGKRPKNMKNVAREFLKQFNTEISTDARIETTHSAVKKLIDLLEK